MAKYPGIEYVSNAIAAGDAVGTGIWTPQRQGLVAWTFDPSFMDSAKKPTEGKVALMPVVAPYDVSVDTVYMAISTVATAPVANQCFIGIYDAIGNLIGQTGDISSLLTSATLIEFPLQSPVELKSGGLYYVGLLQNAATGATFRAAFSTSNPTLNIGLGRWYETTASGLTALPDPLGAISTTTNSLFVALK